MACPRLAMPCFASSAFLIRSTPWPPVPDMFLPIVARGIVSPSMCLVTLLDINQCISSPFANTQNNIHIATNGSKNWKTSHFFFRSVVSNNFNDSKWFDLTFLSDKGCIPWKHKTLSLMAVSHQAGSDPSDPRPWYASRCHHKILQRKAHGLIDKMLNPTFKFVLGLKTITLVKEHQKKMSIRSRSTLKTNTPDRLKPSPAGRAGGAKYLGFSRQRFAELGKEWTSWKLNVYIQ